jgi:hypothetical protein
MHNKEIYKQKGEEIKTERRERRIKEERKWKGGVDYMVEARREELEKERMKVQLLFYMLLCRPMDLKRGLPLLVKKDGECEHVAEEKNCTKDTGRDDIARKT